MAKLPTLQEIDEYADSIGYEPLYRGDSGSVREYVNKVTGSDRIPRNQMAQRAAAYYERIEDERAEIEERPEPTAEQLVRFHTEYLEAWRNTVGTTLERDRVTAILAGVAQGLVSQQGLILKEKETAQ